jgi:hypothetical protein
VKLPFVAQLGLVTPETLKLNLMLFPAVAVGALLGRPVVERVNQKIFESVVLALTVGGALKLLFL